MSAQGHILERAVVCNQDPPVLEDRYHLYTLESVTVASTRQCQAVGFRMINSEVSEFKPKNIVCSQNQGVQDQNLGSISMPCTVTCKASKANNDRDLA